MAKPRQKRKGEMAFIMVVNCVGFELYRKVQNEVDALYGRTEYLQRDMYQKAG